MTDWKMPDFNKIQKEEPKGRRICAWCKKDMGPAGTEMDSHGMCKDCEIEFRKESGLPPKD